MIRNEQESLLSSPPSKDSLVKKLQTLKNSDPDLMMDWLKALSDLEQKVISVLYSVEKATTIKSIRFQLLANTVLFYTEKETIDKFATPFLNFFPIDPQSKALLKNQINQIKEPADKLRIGVALVERMRKFPSFRTIKNVINDLISLGIVYHRSSDSNKRILGLYALNPFVRSQIKKQNEK